MKSVVCWMPGTILHPHSAFKVKWDIVLTFAILYSVCVIPYNIGFDVDSEGFQFVLDTAIDIFFGLDIIVNLFTAFYDSFGMLNTKRCNIVQHYLLGWFLIDFCCEYCSR